MGKDTGTILVKYYHENLPTASSRIHLTNGRFEFDGSVNRAASIMIFTDEKVIDVDDSSVLRFLVQPGVIHVEFDVNHRDRLRIAGSPAQDEKVRWNKENFLVLKAGRDWYDSARLYARLYSKDPGQYAARLNRIGVVRDSLYDVVKALDIGYVERHPQSYLSGFLLWWHVRRLPVDSTEKIFNRLSDDVKWSTLGHQVLEYVYPLTDDSVFRAANPLFDDAFNRRLNALHSVYDLTLKDTTGHVFQWDSHKGKYLVIDFWASWCKPCVANIPSLMQLEALYKHAPVEFISVSMDLGIADWKHALEKYHFTGIQLSDPTGFDGLAAVYCKVLWVPTYLLVGPDGKVIKYDIPQAVDPGLKELIDETIRKHE